MRHNLTAVFNNQDDAQHVLDELLVSGHPRSAITLVSPPAAGAAGRTPDAGFGGTVKQALARLFGAPHHEPEVVGEPAFLPGRHVINVTAATEPDSMRAVGIIERFSPVYVEDRRKPAERAPGDAEPTLVAERTFRARRTTALPGRRHAPRLTGR